MYAEGIVKQMKGMRVVAWVRLYVTLDRSRPLQACFERLGNEDVPHSVKSHSKRIAFRERNPDLGGLEAGF